MGTPEFGAETRPSGDGKGAVRVSEEGENGLKCEELCE